MRLDVDQRSVFAAGDSAGESGLPLALFLHGAGMDHSVWALQSRWFAHHGRRALAVDLPGHGRSEGPPLTEIGALADWTARVIEAAGAKSAALVGHSMGALIALESAARRPRLAARLVLVGVSATMPVHPDLLAAAKANSPLAVDMVSLWSLGAAATLGGSPAPGLWMLGGAARLLENAPPGVLHADLAACDAYRSAAEAAPRIACPTTLVLGERDLMTPSKGGRALAALIPGARTDVIAGAGHMLMIERPAAVLEALKAALAAM
ncbi:MAG TPA: alpha/beta hydrolase [Roseiarcus sp.]|jgi:pimeloyl-ACP methyl ester carboxylesterase